MGTAGNMLWLVIANPTFRWPSRLDNVSQNSKNNSDACRASLEGSHMA